MCLPDRQEAQPAKHLIFYMWLPNMQVRDADTTNSNPSSVSAIVRWTSLFGRKLQQVSVSTFMADLSRPWLTMGRQMWSLLPRQSIPLGYWSTNQDSKQLSLDRSTNDKSLWCHNALSDRTMSYLQLDVQFPGGSTSVNASIWTLCILEELPLPWGSPHVKDALWSCKTP